MMTPGTKLGGRYRLDERIAVGGMGEVWRAADEVLGREVAVKVLLPSLLSEPGFIERFRGEARVVATLTHPNIVRVYDYGESPMDGGGHVAFLVMEFVSGESLTKRLQQRGRLSAAEALPLIAQAAEALHEAHRHGVIHRDVKPGNLLLAAGDKVMLTDFGIARSAMTGGLTEAGSVLGTAAYISPEQASGAGVTGQSDVYSLGIVTYQCLAGRRPFDSDNPVDLAMRHVNDEPPPLPADVDDAARAFTAHALAKDPAVRFATGEAMAMAARAATNGVTPPGPISPATPEAPGGAGFRGAAVPPPGRGLDADPTSVGPVLDPQTAAGDQRRNKLLLVVAAAVLVLVLAVGGAWALINGSDSGDENGGGGDGDSQDDGGDGGKGGDDGGDEPFEINAQDYLNQDPEAVKTELTDAGFTNVVFQGTGSFVADVTPAGPQEFDAEITIHRSMTEVDADTEPSDGEQPSDGECSAGGDIGDCIG
ncbi:MAG: serine/threonine-protein kinase [Stackebrandtia sp.]